MPALWGEGGQGGGGGRHSGRAGELESFRDAGFAPDSLHIYIFLLSSSFTFFSTVRFNLLLP